MWLHIRAGSGRTHAYDILCLVRYFLLLVVVLYHDVTMFLLLAGVSMRYQRRNWQRVRSKRVTPGKA